MHLLSLSPSHKNSLRDFESISQPLDAFLNPFNQHKNNADRLLGTSSNSSLVSAAISAEYKHRQHCGPTCSLQGSGPARDPTGVFFSDAMDLLAGHHLVNKSGGKVLANHALKV